MIPLTIAVLGGLGLLMAAGDQAAKGAPKGRPEGAKDPFSNLPTSHVGKEFKQQEHTAASGRRYRTDSTGPDGQDNVLVVAQRTGKLFDSRGNELGRPWIAYLSNRQTQRRKLWRAFAPGRTKAESDKIVTDMMKDFGVVR